MSCVYMEIMMMVLEMMMMIKEWVPQKSITIIKQSQTRCKHPRLLQKDDGDDDFDKSSDN